MERSSLIVEWLSDLWAWIDDNQIYYGIVFAFAIGAGVRWLRTSHRRIRQRMGILPMTTPEREQYVKSLVADKITDGVEELAYAGKLTPAEVREIYYRLGNFFKNPDLLPKGQQFLKEYIRQRRLETDNTPIPFPDEAKPVERKPKPLVILRKAS